MSLYFLWVIFASIFGNPLIAALIVLVIAWYVGRKVFFRARPLRFVQRYFRAQQLRRAIEEQDWNRAARFELAAWLRERQKYAEARDVLKPNLDFEDDVDTRYVMGVASYGAGDVEEGERYLARIAAEHPKHKVGEVFLELGRFRLQHGDIAGAREVLTRFVKERSSTVEGRVLLSQALDKTGETAAAKAMRDEAWQNYRSAPRFLRRTERFWAYRVRPLIGLAWVIGIVAVAVTIVVVLGNLAARFQGGYY